MTICSNYSEFGCVGLVDRASLWLGREDAGYDVVVVGFGDLGAVKAALLRRFKRAEVVDKDSAVDLRGVKPGASFA